MSNQLKQEKDAKKSLAKWDARFFCACQEIATWSSCLSRQIGAVLVRDRTIIATGFNGPPRGLPHCGSERTKTDIVLFHLLKRTDEPVFGNNTMCPRQRLGYHSGQGLGMCPAAHAEDNCITNAARIGVATAGASIYLSCGIPCKNCLIKIINAGIIEIICTSMKTYDVLSNWIMEESDLIIRTYEHKEEE